MTKNTPPLKKIAFGTICVAVAGIAAGIISEAWLPGSIRNMFLLPASACVVVGVLAGLVTAADGFLQLRRPPTKTIEEARSIKERFKAKYNATAMNGVGLGQDDTGNYCLKVNLISEVGRSAIPAEFEGLKVVTAVIGTIRARE